MIDTEQSPATWPDACFVAGRAVSASLLLSGQAGLKEKPRSAVFVPATCLQLRGSRSYLELVREQLALRH